LQYVKIRSTDVVQQQKMPDHRGMTLALSDNHSGQRPAAAAS